MTKIDALCCLAAVEDGCVQAALARVKGLPMHSKDAKTDLATLACGALSDPTLPQAKVLAAAKALGISCHVDGLGKDALINKIREKLTDG